MSKESAISRLKEILIKDRQAAKEAAIAEGSPLVLRAVSAT